LDGNLGGLEKAFDKEEGVLYKSRRENVIMKEFLELIKDDMQNVEEEFQGWLTSQVPRLTEVAQDLINRGGKRFRPALLLLSARLCGYTGADHIPLAAAIEFIHTATLLHDDVIDDAEVRRGSLSANRQVGNRYSVLTGDFLFCKSLAMGIAIGDLRVLQTLIATTTALAEGEAMEMEKADKLRGDRDLSMSEDENLALIINKTAVLIAAATRIGAILGKAPPSVEEALAHYGLRVGIAFQMVDDCLDYLGDEEVLRKETGTDLKEGKITLPLIYTLGQCSPMEKEEIQEVIIGEEFPADGLQRVIALIDKYHGFDYTFAKAQQHVDAGKERLLILSQSPEREALFAGADYVVRRKI
jgi:octaprenyl-diphosphate synthase